MRLVKLDGPKILKLQKLRIGHIFDITKKMFTIIIISVKFFLACEAVRTVEL